MADEQALLIPLQHIALPIEGARWLQACRHASHRDLGAAYLESHLLRRRMPANELDGLHWATMMLHAGEPADALTRSAQRSRDYLCSHAQDPVLMAYARFAGQVETAQAGAATADAPATEDNPPEWMADDMRLLDMLRSGQELDRVQQLNRLFSSKELQEVALVDEAADGGPLSALDRLGRAPQATPIAPGGSGSLVTIIMPLYNAAQTLPTALRSLAQQTWPTLEIIAVDDASTDSTPALLHDWAQKDARIRVVRQPVNQGAYAARNLGLTLARGEFVTVADGDDWHHPQKIERQCRHLQRHPAIVANMPAGFRATDDLRPVARQQPLFKHASISSLMFRREPVMAALGGWNRVRFGADTEFHNRLTRIFGHEAIFTMDAPLIISRVLANSLTNDARFGYIGYSIGARKEYEASYQHFLRHAPPDALRYPLASHAPLPFAVPTLARSDGQADAIRSVAAIYAGDFRDPDAATRAIWHHARAGHLGIDLELLHVPLFRPDLDDDVVPFLRDYLFKQARCLPTIGEKLDATRLILHQGITAADVQSHYPDITPGRVLSDAGGLPLAHHA